MLVPAVREAKHPTQAELAEKLAVSAKAISKWETAHGLPDISLLEPLAAALGVSVLELMQGEPVINRNRSANLLRSKLYVCPLCGNVLHATGQAVVSCCGITLPPLDISEADNADEHHQLTLERVEDELFVTIHHPMTKDHYISFIACLTNYICIRKDMTIRQAMSELVKQAGENDNISTLYVVDENDKFYGAIDLKDLIIARAEDSLEKLIARSYPYVTDHEKISDCIDRIVDYAERSLPVLNDAGELVGIITSADVVELVDDEMGDDYAKLGGLTGEEDLNEGVFESVKKRLPWLVALLFLGMLVSSVVGAFESVVAVLPIVICFQSMVLDMAGNVGTQSLAVTIRVLVDENLTTSKKLHLLWKEMRVGLVNGALLAVMALGFLGCYIHFFKAYAWGQAFLLSGCVGFSLIVAMVISSLVGTVIPMLFHKIHIDPAVASGPLITTINDLVAVVVYYGLAMIVLIDMLHLG